MAVDITYFVHGTTTDNEQGLATGWNPGELSEKGIAQSIALGKTYAGKTFDTYFSSDLKRAVDSAHLAFGEHIPLIQDQRLREANYGDFNGAAVSAFKERMEDFIDEPFPNGESYKDTEVRMRAFLYELLASCDGQSISITAHQAPQLALDVILGGKTWEQAIAEDWRKSHAWQPGWAYLLA